ncbi:MAG: TA system VapC family ribonuclease toxin [Ramlibacter sp.]
MRALLDVNVLIALHDRDHVHHERAADWFLAHAKKGWSSCPLTQNGCLRIMSQPAYPSPRPLAALMDMLRHSTSAPAHEFWSDDTSILDTRHFRQAHMHSHRQITDIYLLALAVKNGGRLVSFDIRIPLTAVPGAAPSHLIAL